MEFAIKSSSDLQKLIWLISSENFIVFNYYHGIQNTL